MKCSYGAMYDTDKLQHHMAVPYAGCLVLSNKVQHKLYRIPDTALPASAVQTILVISAHMLGSD